MNYLKLDYVQSFKRYNPHEVKISSMDKIFPEFPNMGSFLSYMSSYPESGMWFVKNIR